MYKCKNCGALFTEPDYYNESNFVPYGNGYVREEINVAACPECSGRSITEIAMDRCVCCGDIFEIGELDINDLCAVCSSDITKGSIL